LENPICDQTCGVRKRTRRAITDQIVELKDLKVQSYSPFKIELLKSRKSEVRKFDGKDLVNWIIQMEKYFELHGLPLLQKVRIASNYL